MGNLATKLARSVLALVILFCAGVLPFAPQNDDTDDNFGVASVLVIVSSRSEHSSRSDRAVPQATATRTAWQAEHMASHTTDGREAGSYEPSLGSAQLRPPLRT